jgi:hypothetical protein
MREPEPPDRSVLDLCTGHGGSSSASFLIALRQFLPVGGRPFGRRCMAARDPSLYTVRWLKTARLAGLAVAAAGVWASHSLIWCSDGAASVVIGCIRRGGVAGIRESRVACWYEYATRDSLHIRVIAQQQPQISRLLLTMYIGADDVLLALTSSSLVASAPTMPPPPSVIERIHPRKAFQGHAYLYRVAPS